MSTEAKRLGYRAGDAKWSNLRQGMLEVGTPPGAPPRISSVNIAEADHEYGPAAGLRELREAVANSKTSRIEARFLATEKTTDSGDDGPYALPEIEKLNRLPPVGIYSSEEIDTVCSSLSRDWQTRSACLAAATSLAVTRASPIGFLPRSAPASDAAATVFMLQADAGSWLYADHARRHGFDSFDNTG